MGEPTRWTSVRMRASHGGRHVSGAERLVPFADSTAVLGDLLERADATGACRVVLNIEDVGAGDITTVPALTARTVECRDHVAGQRLAHVALVRLGVSETACATALDLLNAGPNPTGGNMRGAVVMDYQTGRRLEPDPERGVRVSRVDMRPSDRARARDDGPGPRFVDALILASKVTALECVVADVGWSDDPAYLPGYVASSSAGYVRFTALKEPGSPHGGRVYFVRGDEFDASHDIEFLERRPTLVSLGDPT
jgi:6-carboxyhexanoate--CoA ligase